MDAAKQIKELRESTGMSRKDFSEHTGIPVRTLGDWEAASRTHPEYIAFEFASWVSPEFKRYIIKDYKRLKTEENSRYPILMQVKQIYLIQYYLVRQQKSGVTAIQMKKETSEMADIFHSVIIVGI